MENNLKVGDRVSVTGRQSLMKFKGETGTVKIENNGFYIGIEFDESFIHGHELGTIGMCKKSCGYWLRPELITKLEKEEKYAFLSETKVINPNGEIFQVGDKIDMKDSKNPVFKNKNTPTILRFRWSNDKSKICAILDEKQPNGIGIDIIQLYIEPKLKFQLPEKWFVLYNNKEQFNIINKFYNKHWSYINSINENGYYNSNIPLHNNWAGVRAGGAPLEVLIDLDFKKLTFEQFEKYIVNG